MARYVDPSVQDAAFNRIAEADQMHACSRQPISYADLAACTLANVAMSAGDFTISALAEGGRALKVGAKAGVTTPGIGIADHVALVNTVEEVLLFVAVGNAAPITMVHDFQEWFIEISDPVWVP